MKILPVVFPGSTAIDLVGPANAWGLMPGVEFQTAWKTAGPVTVDMGLQLVATHSFADCWGAPDVLFAPGGGMGVSEALQDDELLDAIAAIGTRAAPPQTLAADYPIPECEMPRALVEDAARRRGFF